MYVKFEEDLTTQSRAGKQDRHSPIENLMSCCRGKEKKSLLMV
jgi:hypothetical protein